MRQNATEDSTRKKVVFILILGLSGYFMVSLVRNLVDFSGMDERLIKLEQEAETLREENKKLQEQAKRVESDDFVDVEIRDKLGLAKPGETVIILPQEYLKKSKPREEGKLVIPEKDKPNWRKWVDLFL